MAEILKTGMFGRTGEEILARGKVCGQGEPKAFQVSEGRDGRAVIDVDARVLLEE